MTNDGDNKQRFFNAVWIVFFFLLVSYSIYLLSNPLEFVKYSDHDTNKILPYVSFRMIIGLYFFIAVFNIKKLKNGKLWLWFIVVVGIVSRIILIPSQPAIEDDYYRYLWDGAVTAHGYNPYVYSPEAAMDFTNSDVPDELHELANESGEIVKNINHPHIRTIYPILSQIVFAAAYFIAPWQFWAWKVLLLLFDFALLLILFKTLKELKLPLLFVTFYWLNPVVIHEFYNAAHMDLLALLFVSLSLYLSIKNKTWLAIVTLALAVGFKLWPVILLPLLLRNLWHNKKQLLKYASGFAGLVFVLFIPVLVSNLDKSLGFITYADKWVNNAAVYEIFTWLMQQGVSLTGISEGSLPLLNRLGILIVYLILYVLILRKTPKDNLHFFNAALLITAVLYLISPTQFPWYYTWMLPMLVIRPKASLLLYPFLLPLYQLNYLADYIIYIEHIPVLILFVLELKGVVWKKHFASI
jgi:alpha-1,6-mannosyltransferase